MYIYIVRGNALIKVYIVKWLKQEIYQIYYFTLFIFNTEKTENQLALIIHVYEFLKVLLWDKYKMC